MADDTARPSGRRCEESTPPRTRTRNRTGGEGPINKSPSVIPVELGKTEQSQRPLISSERGATRTQLPSRGHLTDMVDARYALNLTRTPPRFPRRLQRFLRGIMQGDRCKNAGISARKGGRLVV
ncbi:hypothetical protein ROHU_001405 [Labeo rohita]|uniref:Uncharacterized protein n=1 Tax=Labeo rohita TaxID=84645 RepID=A0A498P1R2_LABRO|nr:hypothetical protein ROHU_001405 [Labeo rohita]